jgi:hypothetical protein
LRAPKKGIGGARRCHAKVFRCRTDLRQGIGEHRRGLSPLRPGFPSGSGSSEMASKHGKHISTAPLADVDVGKAAS